MSEGDRAIAWRAPAPIVGARCVFIDRDGVVNERPGDGFVLAWDQFRWRPDAVRAIRSLNGAGLPVVVVSNQSCVGRGLLAPEALVEIMTLMSGELAQAGAGLAAWYCCPHVPGEGCDCRKPRPGMLRRGARELGVDLARSHMIGDTETDIMAGVAAGCAAHLIDPSDPESFARVAESIAALTR